MENSRDLAVNHPNNSRMVLLSSEKLTINFKKLSDVLRALKASIANGYRKDHIKYNNICLFISQFNTTDSEN